MRRRKTTNGNSCCNRNSGDGCGKYGGDGSSSKKGLYLI